MQLWKFEGKKVRLLDSDGDVFIGYADIYHDADDTASGIASLTVIPHGGGYDSAIDFEEPEIVSIEIVTADIPNIPTMAEAI